MVLPVFTETKIYYIIFVIMKPFNNTKSYKLFVAIIISLSIFSINACHKEEPEEIDQNIAQLKISDSSEVNPFGNSENCWQYTNKKIYILFGYDFNDQELVNSCTSLLEKKYGLTADGGLIQTITYPDSFKHNGKNYISDLTSMLTEADGDLLGVIILGAPDNTHIALGRLQDYWSMKVPYPVFSLFPQDESLGMESTCDLVLDKQQTADVTGSIVSEEAVSQKINDFPEILFSCIDYMMILNGPLKKDGSVQAHVAQMLHGKKLQYYTDPETGLHAINHFVLY